MTSQQQAERNARALKSQQMVASHDRLNWIVTGRCQHGVDERRQCRRQTNHPSCFCWQHRPTVGS